VITWVSQIVDRFRAKKDVKAFTEVKKLLAR
jgi:hypothetical protein